MSGHAAARTAAYDAASRQQHRATLGGMNAYDRHKRFMHDLFTYYGGTLPPAEQQVPSKTDADILRDNYRFIRSETDDEAAGGEAAWEVRLARRYYDKLYREYALADMSRYKEGKLGLRWRTQREVVAGKGQFICGAKGCDERRGLASFEVPFSYEEAGQRKQALVKLRVCPTHAYQLNYHKEKEAEAAQAAKQAQRARRKVRRKHSSKSRKERRRGDRISSGSSDSDSATSSSDGSDSEGEAGKRRRKHKKALQEGAPTDQQTDRRPAVPLGAAAAGAANAAGVGKQADEFESFFAGLFE